MSATATAMSLRPGRAVSDSGRGAALVRRPPTVHLGLTETTAGQDPDAVMLWMPACGETATVTVGHRRDRPLVSPFAEGEAAARSCAAIVAVCSGFRQWQAT